MFRVSSLLLSAVLVLTMSADSHAQLADLCEGYSINIPATPELQFRSATRIKICALQPLTTDVRTLLRRSKQSLSESVRNAVFLDEVCIKNKKHPEYLYSPSDEYIYKDSNPQARRVFTWVPGGVDGRWKLLPTESSDTFYIVTVDTGEYLTADTQVVEGRRQVSTRQSPPGSEEGSKDRKWQLVPSGDFVTIKNVEYDEYFYAVEGENYNRNRRTVSAWSHVGQRCYEEAQCLWKIIPC